MNEPLNASTCLLEGALYIVSMYDASFSDLYIDTCYALKNSLWENISCRFYNYIKNQMYKYLSKIHNYTAFYWIKKFYCIKI